MGMGEKNKCTEESVSSGLKVLWLAGVGCLQAGEQGRSIP